ncbi:carboxypeptidase-like regulatory domain-containing protein [Mucilaginibacter kameinonensis]|uniref:carboxypeptidase-like regulatory domain-containing protein n=1 Tax=Mucilaginibacter kameinonensis TaxID=452286 RepID=UPI000EF803F4|nr:carboxypeptidase-like regulatory domain-containing protein [Mucilaginibacter kameinonensis]
MQQFYLTLKRWVVLLLPLFISAKLFAQTNVTGVVRDNTGPLPGVTVQVAGTSNGTQTNANGAYSIKVAKGTVLRFSSVGYTAQEVTVGDNPVINVTLAAGKGELNEVVVTSFSIKRQEKALG